MWLLEVDEEEVIKDYLQTNVDRIAENQRISSKFKDEGFNEAALEALEITLTVKEKYLRSVKN